MHVFHHDVFLASYLILFPQGPSAAQKGQGKFAKFCDFRDIVKTTTHSGEPRHASVVISDMLVLPGDRL